MRWRIEGTREALRSPFPWVALSATLAVTAAGWFGIERERREDARQSFERRTETAVAAVRARMLAYEQVLRSGAAYIASSQQVTRADWRSFVAHLQIEERFPAVQALGYAEAVSAAGYPDHLRRMRADGFAEYDVRPIGPRDEMVVTVFNEPFVGRAARALGFDEYSDPVRRAAIESARTSGEPAVSGRISMPADAFGGLQPRQPGFILYVPVFYDLARDLPRRERRNAVSGYVFSQFRMTDLMRGILDEGVLQVLDMRVYDQSSRTRQEELLDTRIAWRPAIDSGPALFERVVHFPMPGRNWTLHLVSRPEFDAALRAGKPWGVLGAGALATVVVFLLIVALVAAWERAHDQSMRDPLTGLYNRRYMDETMSRELPRARRLGHGVGVVVIDLDHFKLLNDTFGHNAGDFVLARFGELLRDTTRGGDMACRFGGEEFGVIMPGATPEATRNRAEAIRAAFASLDLEFEGAALGTLTLSAGVACLGSKQQDWPRALRDADRALYEAKEAGRNRVVVSASC